jgi:hypothetical protein
LRGADRLGYWGHFLDEERSLGRRAGLTDEELKKSRQALSSRDHLADAYRQIVTFLAGQIVPTTLDNAFVSDYVYAAETGVLASSTGEGSPSLMHSLQRGL